MKSLSVLLLMLSLGGCATGYQGSGIFSITGGYYEVPVNPQLTKVVFSGNAYITTETAAKYTLFRCAELAQKQNKEYFVIYQSLFHASSEEPATEISMGSLGGKPVTNTYLKLLDKKMEGAFVTADVLKEMEAMKSKQTNENSTKNKKGAEQ